MTRLVQLVGSCVGLGVGTAVQPVILLLGPAVELLRRTFPIIERVRA